jgi:hypothetical protein
LIQAIWRGVENPRPKALSKKAHRKKKPTTIRMVASTIRAAGLVTMSDPERRRIAPWVEAGTGGAP